VNAVKTKRKWPRWLTRLVGAVSVFFSVFSILLSVAMPGVGWVIAAINIFLASVLTPMIGRRFLGICLGITVVHLFSFGPLSDVQSSLGLPLYFSVIFILVPMVAAVATMLAPIYRARKRRSV
jgi:hypothetical protein